MDEAKDKLPKVDVEVIPAGEKVKIEIEAEDFTSFRASGCQSKSCLLYTSDAADE